MNINDYINMNINRISYICNQTTRFCMKDNHSENTCTVKLTTIKNIVRDKINVKTSGILKYINANTSSCHSSCCGDSIRSVCKCDVSTNKCCKSTQVQNGNYCNSSKHQIYDYTGTTQKCIVSNCTEYLVR
ncbi:hypothetical protein EDI_142160 [Entamoeba dispar SAW760]|uniref:Uncharacterized protein n=1 Tax=Entamoeba dispar (strain ATCC PRA-260 / SAW760) TaxID=370354 RepID=B0E7H5_ENTDS|nr:uncharacterized protein EDI_142160 [Entamoeba dispar SAW760]EDR29525.1 hypothetical protein EDI_142160 [Entamoeba dispar SAW760]|eukprot:EDR29525.1 hypothetical protein EDI_142160 [Entamoeba dispar SAW760]